MEEQPGQIDEAAIKAAARKAWGEQQAPDDLRRSIAAIALAARPTPPRFKIAPRPLAAAAVLVIGIGAVIFQLMRLRPVTPQLPNHYRMPAVLVTEFATRHDADSYIRAAGNDFSKIGKDLSQKLQIEVLCASPGPDYQFEGASICTIGASTQVAHLLFKRGPESLSVFSMAADGLPQQKQWAQYDGGDAKHAMAGFVHNGGFYCITASGPNSVRCSGMVSAAMHELSSKFPSECTTAPTN